ncbi:MAG: hypothetical protein ACM3P1_06960 [Candidatus Saccharibacteria bacterium]
MKDFQNHCFVCNSLVDVQKVHKNKELNLPVCENCKDTEQEKRAVADMIEGLAEGFVCGCI